MIKNNDFGDAGNLLNFISVLPLRTSDPELPKLVQSKNIIGHVTDGKLILIRFNMNKVKPMYHKILLPTDGSKFAEKAAQHAIWIASKSNAEIIVLNVIETSSLVGLPAEDLIVKIKEMLKEEGRRSLEKISEMVTESEKESKIEDIKITLKSEEGSPADSILKTIEKENIDLVVMGTSGKHGLDRFLLGSVTEKVVRSAKCPVLSVHS
ncbi:MAG: Universal stress protein [Methanobacterium sp. PtaB.Bin024]|nr:MAG: Universal stress protein [Methanobacterium sp. PtaB.Bin024]